MKATDAMKLPAQHKPMAAHKCSRAIAKARRPPIKIVHVLAPEVIKTDARHFRDLVQRLTGKPARNGAGDASPEPTASPPDSCGTPSPGGVAAAEDKAAAMKVEVKEEEVESLSGGFLSALGEEDDVLFPFPLFGSWDMDVVGDHGCLY